MPDEATRMAAAGTPEVGAAAVNGDGHDLVVDALEAELLRHAPGVGRGPRSGTGVFLCHDSSGVDHEYGDLIAKHTPVYVAFPEPDADAPTPYPSGRSDYHPRAVQMYLDEAAFRFAERRRFYYLAVAIWVAGVLLFLFGSSALRMIGLESLENLAEIAGSIGISGASVFAVYAYKTSSAGAKRVRERLEEDEGASLDAGVFRLRTPGNIKTMDESHAWKLYKRAIGVTEATGPSAPSQTLREYPRTIYARVTLDRGVLVLQYWAFYLYNDWANKHEADWEVVMLYFPATARGFVTPRRAVYSSHLGGLWRPWESVRKLRLNGDAPDAEGTHPVVYVARGSHAQYFEPDSRGFESFLTRPLANKFFKARWQLGWGRPTRRKRDFVPSIPVDRFGARDTTLTYGLEVMPTFVEDVLPEDPETWDKWWWVLYKGLWGESVRGPAAQRIRWESPYDWAKTDCLGDLGRFERNM
jgi:hypothetical protein